MADPVKREPTDEDLDERFVLKGDPEDALRRLLNGPSDPDKDEKDEAEATQSES